MTPNELRALADALEPMSSAPRFEGMNVLAFCKWLRAQADAQPVAYRQWNSDEGYWYYGDASCAEKDDELLYAHPAPAVPQAEPKRSLTAAERDVMDSALRSSVKLVARGVAAPQAEPCIGNDPTCPCQDGDACHYKDAADGTKGWPVPQAEPKREPLREEGVVATLVREGVNKHKAREIVAWIKQHGIGGSDAE